MVPVLCTSNALLAFVIVAVFVFNFDSKVLLTATFLAFFAIVLFDRIVSFILGFEFAYLKYFRLS